MSPIELPFLYQTRTILRCFSSTSKALRNNKYPAPSTQSEETSETFLSQKARETAGSATKKSKPSITRTEKQVFDEIFHDIQTSTGQPANTKNFYNETDPDAIFRLFVQESGQHQNRTNESAVESEKQGSSDSGWNEHLKRYPPILRHAAKQLVRSDVSRPTNADHAPYISFQPSAPDAQSSLSERKIKDPRHGVYRPLEAALDTEADKIANVKEGLQLRNFDAIKKDEIARGTFRGKTADYVEAELKKISEELQSCLSRKNQSGDFMMWDVCQKRILPIVLALNQRPQKDSYKPSNGIETANVPQHTSNSAKNKTKKVEKKQVAKQETSNNSPPPTSKADTFVPTFPSGVSPLGVVSTLYPTLTLLAFRLLTTHFPTSPFSLSLYTAIKTTSPQSRILGLNIHFYNTLLRHLWDIYSDLHALTSTLREMQASGVDFDGDTYAVIQNIEEERWNEFHAGEGSRGVAWWGRPEQTRRYQEMLEWKAVVANKLQEQGMGHLLAEREYGSDLLGGRESDEVEGPRVWL
jgi:hypothetical protein